MSWHRRISDLLSRKISHYLDQHHCDLEDEIGPDEELNGPVGFPTMSRHEDLTERSAIEYWLITFHIYNNLLAPLSLWAS